MFFLILFVVFASQHGKKGDVLKTIFQSKFIPHNTNLGRHFCIFVVVAVVVVVVENSIFFECS